MNTCAILSVMAETLCFKMENMCDHTLFAALSAGSA